MTEQTHPLPDADVAAGRVVVAVGPEEVQSALEFGVEEARRAGCGVHLVHVVHIVPTGPEAVMVTTIDLDKFGRETLDMAVEHARHLTRGEVPLSHELRRGSPGPTLVAASKGARMVVLEHRHLSRMSRIVNRTVAGSVAAYSRVPVVAVPSGWRRHEGRPVVVVGVDVPERARPLIRTAARQARNRGARLKVVHTWMMPFTYEGLELSAEEVRRWTDRSIREVRDVLAELTEATEGLDVDVVVRHGRASEILLEEAGDAELLVVGRHDPLVPLGSHVGPVTRAVLREATCPVLLPDPTPRHRA